MVRHHTLCDIFWRLVYALKPHQLEALDAALKGFTEHSTLHDVLACGTGKTILARALSDAVAAHETVLALVPRINLVTQTIADFRNLGDTGLGTVLAICSERSLVWDRRLDGLRVHQTTDPADLAHAVAAAPGRVTVVATYQSLDAIIGAHRDHGLRPWKLVVLDEAHRLTGSPRWARALDAALVPAQLRKATTGTPVVLEKRPGATSTRMLSMDDEARFGPRCFTLSFPEARERGLLVPYTLATPVVTRAEVRLMIDRAEHLAVMSGGAISAQVMALQLAVLKAMRRWGGTRALTFHPRVVDARLWARTLPHVADLLGQDSVQVWARHLNQDHPLSLRERVLSEFNQLSGPNLRFVTNVGLFRDGYDSPGCDTVVLTHSPSSAASAVQILSRALRVDPHRPNKRALFVLPVVLSHDYAEQPLSQILTDGGWRPLWQALRALGALDEGVLTQARRALRHNGAAGVTGSGAQGAPGLDASPASSARARFPSWWAVEGVPVPQEFADAITVRAAREIAPPHDEYLAAFDAHIAVHRTAYIHHAYVTDTGLDLGAWIRRVLDPHRKQVPNYVLNHLERVGLDRHEPYSASVRGRDEAQLYFEEFQHLNVPSSYTSPRGYALGSHIDHVRQLRKGGKLSHKLIAWWDERGMVWDAERQRLEEAQARYRTAGDAYVAEFGNINAPQDYVDPSGFNLGTALTYRRRKYRQGKLDAHDVDWHENHGVIWEINEVNQKRIIEEKWEQGFSLAQKHYRKHGHLRVKRKRNADPEENKLAAWVEAQNRRWDQLTPSQRQRLVEIGFPERLDLAQVRASVRDGATNPDLDSRFGMSLAVINGQLEAAGHPPVVMLRRQAIAARARQGHRVADLAQIFRVAHTNIVAIVDAVERGVFRTDLSDAPSLTPEEAREVFKETGSIARTSLVLGITPADLRRLLLLTPNS